MYFTLLPVFGQQDAILDWIIFLFQILEVLPRPSNALHPGPLGLVLAKIIAKLLERHKSATALFNDEYLFLNWAQWAAEEPCLKILTSHPEEAGRVPSMLPSAGQGDCLVVTSLGSKEALEADLAIEDCWGIGELLSGDSEDFVEPSLEQKVLLTEPQLPLKAQDRSAMGDVTGGSGATDKDPIFWSADGHCGHKSSSQRRNLDCVHMHSPNCSFAWKRSTVAPQCNISTAHMGQLPEQHKFGARAGSWCPMWIKDNSEKNLETSSRFFSL